MVRDKWKQLDINTNVMTCLVRALASNQKHNPNKTWTIFLCILYWIDNNCNWRWWTKPLNLQAYWNYSNILQRNLLMSYHKFLISFGQVFCYCYCFCLCFNLMNDNKFFLQFFPLKCCLVFGTKRTTKNDFYSADNGK